jgi:hypothetical protein
VGRLRGRDEQSGGGNEEQRAPEIERDTPILARTPRPYHWRLRVVAHNIFSGRFL